MINLKFPEDRDRIQIKKLTILPCLFSNFKFRCQFWGHWYAVLIKLLTVRYPVRIIKRKWKWNKKAFLKTSYFCQYVNMSICFCNLKLMWSHIKWLLPSDDLDSWTSISGIEVNLLVVKLCKIYIIYSFDLDLDPMTLLFKHDLDTVNTVKMDVYTENVTEFLPLAVQNLQPAEIHRKKQTNRQIRPKLLLTQ